MFRQKKSSLLLLSILAVCWVFLPLGAAASDGKTHVRWLGQSSVLITTPGGKVIMIDPFLIKNPKTPKKYKDLAALGKIDLILVTHGHFDHRADAPALSKLNNAPVWAPPGLNDSFVALGVLEKKMAPRMNKGGVIQPLGPGIKITMVRAEHSSELKMKDPDLGKVRVFSGGEPCGWIIEMENGFKVYHMGDTGLFGDMKFIGEYYNPDLILMPIGGHYVMSPKDAAYATNTYLKPRHVIPIHYGTIPVLKGTPAEYQQALGRTSTKVYPIDPGEEVTF